MAAVMAAALIFAAGCREADDRIAADTAAAEATVETAEESAGNDSMTTEESRETEAEKTGFYFSDFEAEDFDGNTVDESIFANAELTMINMWGTFCSPCISEMPDLGELSEEWKEKGIQIIGVCIDIADRSGNTVEKGLEEAKSIVEETGAAYMHLAPNPDMMERYVQYVYAVPTTIFVDKDGNQVGQAVMGAKDKAGWEKEFEARLESVRE